MLVAHEDVNRKWEGEDQHRSQLVGFIWPKSGIQFLSGGTAMRAELTGDMGRPVLVHFRSDQCGARRAKRCGWVLAGVSGRFHVVRAGVAERYHAAA